MLSLPRLPKRTNRPPELDHQQLYAIGLKHVQRLSSRIWTDYNVHDPGITTLELLCYALTDLSYRASFPIADLLASPSHNRENMQQQFFTARQILPNRALTTLDYRKLLIDLPGVKNAWIQPATQTYYADTQQSILLATDPGRSHIIPVELSGLYHVIIDYMDDIANAADQARVLQSVQQRLQANRNLCEDFVSFEEVQSQSFLLCAELELTPTADVSQVKAEILFQVQQYLAPPVKNYSLSEMLTRRKGDGTLYTVDEIFDGPTLDCGFIDDTELAKAELRTQIRLSDVISILMDIQLDNAPAVRTVRDIVVNPEGMTTPLPNPWLIPVAPGQKALLDLVRSRLVFYKRNMPVVADEHKVRQHYEKLVAEAKKLAETPVAYDLNMPLGTYRQSDRYYSVQNHFPAIYGLSETGLSSTADHRRQALAHQLKAYLLFFDQIMANYFAQLSQVPQLFSTDETLHHTYFFQVVDTFAQYQKIYASPDIKTVLQNQNNQQEQADNLKRRHHFLDHLIARFAERFHEFAAIMYSAFGASAASMVTAKCRFLQHYPTISSERSIAYNYSMPNPSDLWDADSNVSGLEKRLAKLLNINPYRRQDLIQIDYDIYSDAGKFLFRIRNPATDEILLNSIAAYDTAPQAIEGMQQAIHAALLRQKYQKKSLAGGKFYFTVTNSSNQDIARSAKDFNSAAERDAGITATLQFLSQGVEGMYLIENILLRPAQPGDPFLPVCLDPGCSDCVEKDPYSYRIHVLLPAYGDRFSNMEFRRFVEQVIREEVPAHILPKLCWISREEMAVLQKQYREWMALKAGADTSQRTEKLTALIKTLFTVRNVYPVGQLHECDSSEEKPKFILGQTALGTENLT
jgi:uncharacterized protein